MFVCATYPTLRWRGDAQEVPSRRSHRPLTRILAKVLTAQKDVDEAGYVNGARGTRASVLPWACCPNQSGGSRSRPLTRRGPPPAFSGMAPANAAAVMPLA